MLPEAQAPVGFAIPLRGAANLAQSKINTLSQRLGALRICYAHGKMDPIEIPPPRQIRCDGCSQITPGYDILHYRSMEQGYRHLCGRCFNTEAAHLAGLEGFEHAKF